MNKNLLFAFLLFATINMASAQAELVFGQNPLEVVGEAVQDEFHRVEAKGKITNVGDETISIRWERVVLSAPDDWDYQVCDNNQCYSTTIYSNVQPEVGLDIPVTLAPGDTSIMTLYALPRGEAGTAMVDIQITDVDNPDVILSTGSYKIEASPVSDVEAPSFASNDITLFPNPTTNYFEVRNSENIDRIVLYNIVGREVRSFNAAPNKSYQINDLANGLYLVSFVSDQQGVVKTLRLNKRSSRP